MKAQNSPNSSLATKMTLRDCTLFVQVPKELIYDESSPEAPDIKHNGDDIKLNGNDIKLNGDGKPHPPSRGIRIVIADLDEKSEANRGLYWRSLEQELISGGYYLGKGKLDPAAEDCDLTGSIWADS